MHIIEGGIFEGIARLSSEDLTHSVVKSRKVSKKSFLSAKMAKMTWRSGMNALHL